MPPPTPGSPPVERPVNAWSVTLKWLSRAFFAGAVAAAAAGIWLRRSAPAPPEATRPPAPRAEVDWAAEPVQRWRDATIGFELVYPARFEPVRGFGRFTSRDLADGLEQTDEVAFRSGQPRSVMVVASYRSPRSLAWEEWTRLAEADTPARAAGGPALAAEFGGSHRVYRRAQQGGRPALVVSGRGGTRYPVRGSESWELWRFESVFMAEGSRAVRLTAGAHTDHFEAARPALRRALRSFRWTPAPDRR